MGFWSLLISLTYSWSLFGSVHDVNILYIYIYYHNIYIYMYTYTLYIYYTQHIHAISTVLTSGWLTGFPPPIAPKLAQVHHRTIQWLPKLWLSPQAVKNHRTKGKTAWKAAGSKRRDGPVGPVEWKIMENPQSKECFHGNIRGNVSNPMP